MKFMLSITDKEKATSRNLPGLLLTAAIPLFHFGFFPVVLLTGKPWGEKDLGTILLGLSLAYIGAVLWIGGMISLGKSFGVLPQVRRRVTGGFYKLLKHPIYLGIFFCYLGLSLTQKSVPGLGYTFVVGIVCSIRAAREEALLI